MITPKNTDIIHKVWLCRILTSIADDPMLASLLRFKGGTCAAMREVVDRFSVDLDFDLIDASKNDIVQKHLETIFKKMKLTIKDRSEKVPQYFLKYPSSEAVKAHTPDTRNTIKVDVTFPPPASNDYEPIRLIEIDRIIQCQTIPTMFANKLVALTERYDRYGTIAGRDVFDIHTLLLGGYDFKKEILEERTGMSAKEYLGRALEFVEKNVTQTIIDQDLNTLLPPKQFHHIRMGLKQETVMMLKEKIKQMP